MPHSPSRAPAPLEGGAVVGRCATLSLTVTEADTALAQGAGDVPVLGTPRLVALCEESSTRALDGLLPPEKTTVASRIQFDHLMPVAVGGTVAAEATLERVEGRRLVFTISVTARSGGQGLVGAGRLTRVVVNRQDFLAKAEASALADPPAGTPA